MRPFLRDSCSIGGWSCSDSPPVRSPPSTTGARTARYRSPWVPSSTTRSCAPITASPMRRPALACRCRPRPMSRTAPGCAATRFGSGRRSSGCGWGTSPGAGASSRLTYRSSESRAGPRWADRCRWPPTTCCCTTTRWTALIFRMSTRTGSIVATSRTRRRFGSRSPRRRCPIPAPSARLRWPIGSTMRPGWPQISRYTQRETGTFVSPALHVDEMDILGPEGD